MCLLLYSSWAISWKIRRALFFCNHKWEKMPVSLRTRRDDYCMSSELCLSLLPPVRETTPPLSPPSTSTLTINSCNLSMLGRVYGWEWSHLNHSLPLEIILEFLSNKKWYLWLKVTMMFSVFFHYFGIEIITTSHCLKGILQVLVCTFCESSVSLFLKELDFDCQEEKESLVRHFMHSKQLWQISCTILRLN